MPQISRLVKLLAFTLVLCFILFYASWPRQIGWKARLNGQIIHGKNILITRLQPRYYQCLEKAESIKAGMTRKELESFARPSGGIAYRYGDEYLLKDCRFPEGYITVHINFKSTDQKRNLLFAQEDDIVRKVSSPFLEFPSAD